MGSTGRNRTTGSSSAGWPDISRSLSTADVRLAGRREAPGSLADSGPEGSRSEGAAGAAPVLGSAAGSGRRAAPGIAGPGSRPAPAGVWPGNGPAPAGAGSESEPLPAGAGSESEPLLAGAGSE